MKAALLGGSDVMLHRVYSEKNFAALEAILREKFRFAPTRTTDG